MIENAAIFYQYLVATKTNLFTSGCKLGKPVTKGERGRTHTARGEKAHSERQQRIYLEMEFRFRVSFMLLLCSVIMHNYSSCQAAERS